MTSFVRDALEETQAGRWNAQMIVAILQVPGHEWPTVDEFPTHVTGEWLIDMYVAHSPIPDLPEVQRAARRVKVALAGK